MMKKMTILLILSLLSTTILCTKVFASGSVDLNITNRTSSKIDEIIIHDITDNKKIPYFITINPNESVKLKVKKDKNYNVVLICVNKHKYGVQNRRFPRNSNDLIITNRNYIFENLESFFRRIIGM